MVKDALIRQAPEGVNRDDIETTFESGQNRWHAASVQFPNRGKSASVRFKLLADMR